jgi:predicted O-methyltransferase YrrM
VINRAAWGHMLLDKSLDTHHHLPYLYEVAKGNILEIGVHCGISTTAFLAGLEDHGGHLWSIDVHPSCRYVHFDHPLWTFYCTWSGDVPSPDTQLDVLFVDGDHSYPAVMKDLETWGHRAKLILCHDADTASFPGVRQAIDEYCNTHSLKHEMRTGSNGLEVIYRG